ncbi:hypothetical protein [Flavobacterium pectinovorum]|uniref:CarboxypepD_reg-like domain-containing protein n=1 Tax=Flavobacterium pectinovorum TaxID=29533 RepID=A0A502E3M8_9FLAO|nr:hypothetical protein [Flavobacterium pectinovorum]TPG32127.1 hypothetical protein EAH81_26215 [Flavobacterium pectinovorum]
MIHKIRISIPEPCHENWLEMSPTEKGKFCSSCQKNVIDFTKASDREILLEYNKNEHLCGRFRTSQLDRTLVLPKEKKPIWMIAAASVIAFLGLGSQAAKAQGKPIIEQTDKKAIQDTIPTDSNITEIEIEGKIFLDETNPNFEEVDILIYDKNQIFHPNADGRFCIKTNKNDRILISKAGYINYSTTAFKSINLGAIELETDNCKTIVVGGAIAIKRSFWYRLFHKN